MNIPGDELDEATFCTEFQQLGQIVDELHGFSFSNTIIPLSSEQQPYSCITCAEFDQKENLLWVSNDQGHTTSFYRVNLTVYSKFWWSIDKTDLIPNQIITTDLYVIFVGKSQINLFTRGGAPVFRHKPELRSINCAHWSSNAPRFLYFGGESNSIGILNLETFKEIKAIESEDNCCLIRSTGRFLVTANQDGQITVRHKDFDQYKIVAKTVAHNAGIEDMDVCENYLVCCGKSVRNTGQHGVPQRDKFIKIYDVRNLGAQSPVGFSRPPIQTKFVPGIDGCICVSTGLSLFMVDILNNKISMFVNFSLPSDGISISNSGEVIAAFINNYTSYLQIFCNSIDPAFSVFNIDPILPIQSDDVFVPFDDKTSLAVFPVAYSHNYCSDKWSGRMSKPHYLCPPPKERLGKDVRYFKSPYVNTIVSGFNVWRFDERSVDPSQASVVENTVPDITKSSSSSPANNGKTSNEGQPNEFPTSNIKSAPTSRFEKVKNAPEFVPRRQMHANKSENTSHEKVEAKSEEDKSDDTAKDKNASTSSSRWPDPKPSRLQNMSFEQFRALANEVKEKQAK